MEAAALVLVSMLAVFLYRQTPEVRRAVEAPASPAVTAPAPEPPAKAGQASGRLEYFRTEKDRPSKEEALDAAREARTYAPPAAEPKLAVRAQGPFHLVGLLRPRNRDTLDSQLGDLVKQAGGILVRDADRVGPGSIVEVVLPREAYPRLEAGLRELGDFTVETRARTFPHQLRIGLRIAD